MISLRLFFSHSIPLARSRTRYLPRGPTNFTGLDSILENIATRMTNLIRSQSQDDLVAGTLLHQQTTVQVQWGYLIAPIIFMVLCLLFFGATVVYQRTSSTKTKTWKSSSLVVLHALGPEAQRELGGMSKSSVLREQAERTAVRLDKAEDTGWRLREVGLGVELKVVGGSDRDP